MSKKLLFGILLLACAMPGCGVGAETHRYPDTPRVDHVDQYHGVEVRDPYRWLEDSDSQETVQWIRAQNEVTSRYLESIPQRNEIESRLRELWDYEEFDVPFKRGGRYFMKQKGGLQNQPVVYTFESLEAEPRPLLDPNLLSSDGTVALTGLEASPDGALLAYGLSSGGSDWQEWKVRDVARGEDLSDHLKWIKFSTVSWSADSRGFFYSRYDEPQAGQPLEETNYYQKLFYHRVGTDQSEDRLIYERPDRKDWGFDGKVTDDGRFLIIQVWQGTDTRTGIFYSDLADPAGPVVELLNQFDASYQFVDHHDSQFWFLTDWEAPRGRVIGIDAARPAREQWTVLIPERESTLETVHFLGNRFVGLSLEDAHHTVQIWNRDGAPAGAITLPGLGKVDGFTGSGTDRETFYSYTSFNQPRQIYHFDFDRADATLFRTPAVAFNPEDFETRQVFCRSKDGTRVPVFISFRRGLEREESHFTLLYGYGGFNIPLTPEFQVANLVWMERGGIYAAASLRGGGEYGREWHQAGMRLNKQNVFDDFIAAAEWLIENHYTEPSRLGIYGRSNGGLLVGACLTQRPDLFGAAVVGVGVLDMLRFHRFTIGWAWVSDYGSPDNPEEFRALYAYSPYHNIRPDREYPATLITTADHDDRVVPLHSFKFAAALQAAQAGEEPVLLRVETRAGHGAGKPTSKRIEEGRDILAFLTHELGAR